MIAVDVGLPPIEPYETGTLDVGDNQSLYWETCGNPSGTPAVVLHAAVAASQDRTVSRHASRVRTSSQEDGNCEATPGWGPLPIW